MRSYLVRYTYIGAPEVKKVCVNFFTALKLLYKHRKALEYSIGVIHICTLRDLDAALKVQKFLNKI